MQFAGTAFLSGACSFVYGNNAMSFNAWLSKTTFLIICVLKW